MHIMNTYRKVTLAGTFVLFFTLLTLSAATLFALDFETARTKGLVGEVDSGYVAIPPGAGTEAQQLVATVNQQRLGVYTEIAAKNGITLEATGQRTFEKRFPDFPAGTWVQMKGTWSKK
ncbi:MAG: YdbL family protein [Chlorobiaceae bacterium]|nr:YdbL family protein [Chlorobiaceae bacterium]